MKIVVILVSVLLCTVAVPLNTEIYDSKTIIEIVTSANTTWEAGYNFEEHLPLQHIKVLLGAEKSPNSSLPLITHNITSDEKIPEEFDARKQWPNCFTIRQIRDQGACGSCWAVAAATALADRFCIASEGNFSRPLSFHELLACCDHCGKGCEGGSSDEAWLFLISHGIVTGGDFHSHSGCQPYQIQPCKHGNATNKFPSCANLPLAATPQCRAGCFNVNYNIAYKHDHRLANSVFTLANDPTQIQLEILKNGPVVATFTVYSDFPAYKNGVYQKTTGEALGGHSVRLIGWGIENKIPYWLAANSWNLDWGDRGIFKILRGKNECGIEDQITAGSPLFNQN